MIELTEARKDHFPTNIKPTEVDPLPGKAKYYKQPGVIGISVRIGSLTYVGVITVYLLNPNDAVLSLFTKDDMEGDRYKVNYFWSSGRKIWVLGKGNRDKTMSEYVPGNSPRR